MQLSAGGDPPFEKEHSTGGEILLDTDNMSFLNSVGEVGLRASHEIRPSRFYDMFVLRAESVSVEDLKTLWESSSPFRRSGTSRT